MQVKYINENNTVNINTLRSGDVFIFDNNAHLLLDQSDCTAVNTDDFVCVRLSDGYLIKFYGGDMVHPMAQSIIEVKK
jgi:hypothetical protein